ncbi:hypothetical protein [Polyangium jinanense]|uniref:Uncharacterized protein n=1 Tax=Polyangium jinanense TaxID=2829994 RepID=A0A9X3X1J5_9BACT|nr:hypothetical protein [Polyangium jinanense]MDC3952904.1 hypothetical protein [Polyangium jinanense]MDC3980523.1 hypothetical protein [Polyangium jinanense]
MYRKIAVVLLAGTTPACLLMMPPGMVSEGTPAQNPLVSGAPLEARSKGKIGVVSEPDCNVWPFEDTMTVKASESEVCVTALQHKDAPPGWTGEPTANSSEGYSVSSGAERGYIDARKTRASKVGSCFNKGFNKQVAIWAFEYEGCTPNNGVLTKASPSLRVGDASWTFPAPAATEPATSAAAKP